MITKLLVANRGEIARRIFRTCRDLGVATVAVYSDPDAGAPHVAEADEAVRLPGTTSAETYLDQAALLAAAAASGADAVHPGYGFLSENAGFARAVTEAGLTWVGPSPEAIAVMGSKLQAKAAVAAHGVPVLPSWAPDEVPADAYPVLVKASAGGGGRGMRRVDRPAELAAAVRAATGEAERAFGDGTVFVERYVTAPRHVEVQVFGDASGRVVSLYERECSVQRRHQKIIEEAPSPAVDPALRERMGAAAVAAAQAVGYVGAGTVEFVLGADGEFAFLEMNTRLQVEHPVTEAVTGLDLVAWQLRVAEGEPLPEVPPLRGHAVEARLYAEDPERGYLPQPGTVGCLRFPAGVRVDAAVVDGSAVPPQYDPLLAKVVAFAPTRAEAVRRLRGALAAARIHGLITNRALLVGILGHPEFRAGQADTGFLDRHDPAALSAGWVGAPAEALHAVAAALAAAATARAGAPVWAFAPPAWRNNPNGDQRRVFTGRHGPHEVAYRFERDGTARIAGRPELRVLRAAPDHVLLADGGVQRRMDVCPHGDGWDVDSPLGASRLVELPRLDEPAASGHAGSLTAPMPGMVLDVLVEPGQVVAAGATLVTIEAMKMQHAVLAPAAGTVTEVAVKPGEQVAAGAVLAVLAEGTTDE